MTVSQEEKSFINGLGAQLPGIKKRVVKPRNIAQSIRKSSNPYLAAITANIRREVKPSVDHRGDTKVFYFEDGSFLTFAVAYEAIADGTDQRAEFRI
jgi:hypothetical protein